MRHPEEDLYLAADRAYAEAIGGRVIDHVLQYFNTDRNAVFTKRRYCDAAKIRQICQWMLRNKTRLIYRHIGLITGSRKHATVLYGQRRIENFITPISTHSGMVIPDPDLARIIHEIGVGLDVDKFKELAHNENRRGKTALALRHIISAMNLQPHNAELLALRNELQEKMAKVNC